MKQVKATPVCVQRKWAKHNNKPKRNLEPRRHLTRNQKEVLFRLKAGDYDTMRGAMQCSHCTPSASVLGWGLFQSFFFLLRRIGVFEVFSIQPEAVQRVLIPLDILSGEVWRGYARFAHRRLALRWSYGTTPLQLLSCYLLKVLRGRLPMKHRIAPRGHCQYESNHYHLISRACSFVISRLQRQGNRFRFSKIQ